MGASSTPPQPQSLRAAVIGHSGRGGYGHGIDTALALVPGVEIVAVADPDASGREAALARRPKGSRAARGYADYQEMLRREGPDLVAVCPRFVGEHEAMVSAAAESGARGVYCEKPFAATPAQGDRMLEVCRRRGVRVVVAHRGRENPYVRWAKRLIDQEIGPLQVMRGHGKGDQRSGAQDTAVLGTHVFDQMRYFAGDVAWATGRVTQRGREIGPQDVHDGPEDLGPLAGDGLEAYYVFRGGVTGHFESYPVDRPGARWFGLELYCARGILSLRDLPRGEVYRYPSGTWLPDEAEGRWERVLLPEWEQAPDGHQRTPQEKLTESNRRNALALVRAVQSGSEPEGVCTAQDALAALEMVFAPAEAQRTGQRVPFPMTQRENPYALLAAGIPADGMEARPSRP
jgi:predicted dehydrogenase